MKHGGAGGAHIKRVIKALEGAGYELSCRNNSRLHYKAPNRPHITIPKKLDDINTARHLARLAGVTL